MIFVAAAFAEDVRQQEAAQSFRALMDKNEVRAAPAARPEPAAGATVQVPLERYEAVRARLAAAPQPGEDLVVLGASSWSGRATEGGLALHLSLHATLAGAGAWKTVPLVGEEVAVLRASVAGEAIALGADQGYQVWVTDRVGEVEIEVDVVVPARGPRGGTEYDFFVAQTPVTRFDCFFPEADLEPRLGGTVRDERLAEAGGTRLRAWLEPTPRLHLVGFKDLGEAEGTARLYVETSSLLSLEERSAELFTVLRYSILEAPTRRFDVFVPAGFVVISAEGDGALRTSTEAVAEGSVLHGETAFPIRDHYEISLRLRHTLAGTELDLAPPRALGAEREQGWLGVEVLDPMQLQVLGAEQVVEVDAAQLPAELVDGAVSPVIEAWRYHEDAPRLRLEATPLPEHAPAAGAIDEVAARTTLAAEGRSRTELRIQLRNRLRHSLRVQLPPGAVARDFEIDGVPALPSVAEDGALLLPLKRSTGERAAPFSLRLVYEAEAPPLGPVGFRAMELPAFELPISTLSWEIRAPARHRWAGPWGEVAPQGALPADEVVGDEARLHHLRYWVAAEDPVRVHLAWLRSALVAPLSLLAVAGLAAAAARARGRAWGAVGLAALALGLLEPALPLAAGGLALAWRLGPRLRAELPTLREAWARPVPVSPGSWRAAGVAGRLGLLLLSAGLGFGWMLLGARALQVLANPW